MLALTPEERVMDLAWSDVDVVYDVYSEEVKSAASRIITQGRIKSNGS
jgi:hypothetical protein